MKIQEILSENSESTKKLTRNELIIVARTVELTWNRMIEKDVNPPKFQAKLDSGEYTTTEAVKAMLHHIVDSNGHGDGEFKKAYDILNARHAYWDLVPQVEKALKAPLKGIVAK